MGKIDLIFYEELIEPIADRNSNLLKVQRSPNQEVTIHFRNLKIVLHTEEEIREWKDGFAQALEKLGDRLLDDV